MDTFILQMDEGYVSRFSMLNNLHWITIGELGESKARSIEEGVSSRSERDQKGNAKKGIRKEREILYSTFSTE